MIEKLLIGGNISHNQLNFNLKYYIIFFLCIFNNSIILGQSFASLAILVNDADNKTPIGDAQFLIKETGWSSKFTGSDGKIFFDRSIPIGEINYIVIKEGYNSKQAAFNITTEEKSNTLLIELVKILKIPPKKDLEPMTKSDFSTTVVGNGNTVVGGQGNQIVIEQPDVPIFKLINSKVDSGEFYNNYSTKKIVFKYKASIEILYKSPISKNRLEFALNYKELYHMNIFPFISGHASMSMGGSTLSDEFRNARIPFLTSPVNGNYKIEILLNENIPELSKFIGIRVDNEKIYSISSGKEEIIQKNINYGINNGVIGDNAVVNTPLQPHPSQSHVLDFIKMYPNKDTEVTFYYRSDSRMSNIFTKELIALLKKEGYTKIGEMIDLGNSMRADFAGIHKMNNTDNKISYFIQIEQ